MSKKTINVGLIGCGTVGSGVVKLFEQNAELIDRAAGVKVRLKTICDLEVTGPLITKNAAEILKAKDIQIVIEAIGGTEPAREYILSALKAGKYVVTSNKEVIAKHGSEILKAAQSKGVEVLFEASVGGGIPIIKPLRESLAANHITEIYGIVNGTCNYILSKMENEHKTFSDALAEAQAKGYAEANPQSDIGGYDSAYKAIILAAVGFDAGVDLAAVYIEGIQKITLEDIQYAKEIGYSVKLLAILKRAQNELEVRVHPTLVPYFHPLASILEAYNAIFVKGDAVGQLMFYGPGAGSLPTASSILSDVIDIAKKIRAGVKGLSQIKFNRLPVKSMAEISSRYYVRFRAPDRPGVLASISGVFGQKNVSIQAAMQKETIADKAQIIIIIHSVKGRNIQEAFCEIQKLPNQIEVANVIRVGLD